MTSISSRIGAYPATIAPGAMVTWAKKLSCTLGGGGTAQPGMGPLPFPLCLLALFPLALGQRVDRPGFGC